jgi:hypothetical protein
MIDDNTIKAS